MAKENSVIDWEAYGVVLKAARLANGYSRGKKLVDALQQVLPELNDPEFIRPIFRNSNMKVMLVEL